MRLLLWTLLAIGCGSSSSYHGLGAACAKDADCSVGTCAINTLYPDGYCWIQSCNTADDCGSDGDCTHGGDGLGGGCLLKCNDDSDCRTGYHCCPDFNQVKVCAPAMGTAINC